MSEPKTEYRLLQCSDGKTRHMVALPQGNGQWTAMPSTGLGLPIVGSSPDVACGRWALRLPALTNKEQTK